MDYTNVFGSDTVPPAGQTYRLIPLVAHARLNWPSNYEGPDFICDINNVTGSAANWHIALPSARGQSTGRDFLMRNVGLYAFQVDNFSDAPVATLQPGEVKYFYLTDNAQPAGVWNVFTFGTGTSAADASQLQGSGLTVVGSKLAAAHPVYSLSSNVSAAATDRATIFAFVGGSNTLTLPSVLTLNDNWFCGVVNGGSGSVTIAITGIDRIDNATSKTLTPGESLFIFCSGATYYTIGYGRSTQFQFTKLVKDVSAGGSFTLTSGEASNKLLQFTGVPLSNVTINVPAVVSVYYVQNAYSGAATLTVKTAAGAGATLTLNNEKAILFCDGVNVVAATSGGGGGGGISSAPDGTAATPSFTFNLDTDTGFYRIGSNIMGLAAGGAEAARWSLTDASVTGNFGIGTITPQGKLDVRGVAIISGGGALAGTLPAGTQLQVAATDGGSTRQMIDSYGSSDGSYLTFRQARGTASVPTSTLAGQNLGQVTFRGRGATAWSGDRAYLIGRASENWSDTAQGTLLTFAVTPAGSTVPGVRMVLDQNGWMALGADVNPANTLDVRGGISSTDRALLAGATITWDSFPLTIINRQEEVPLNATGMVQLRTTNSGIVADVGYWQAGTNYPFGVLNKAGTQQVLKVDQTGTVSAYGYVTLSDETMKSEWLDIPTDFLQRLAGVKHGTFVMAGIEERQAGVSAQSMLPVLPESVYKDFNGMLHVSYGNAALVACIELADQVLKLTKEVESLKSLH